MKKLVLVLLSLIVSSSAFAQNSDAAFERQLQKKLKESTETKANVGLKFTTVVSKISDSTDLDVVVKADGQAICHKIVTLTLGNDPIQGDCGNYALTLQLIKNKKGDTLLYQGIGWKNTKSIFFSKNTYVTPSKAVTASTDPESTAYNYAHAGHYCNGVNMCK